MNRAGEMHQAVVSDSHGNVERLSCAIDMLLTIVPFCIIAFGIGSMIYSGLEFGQYFELERDTKCHNVMLALTPATRMAFIFIQMYFIFLNNEVS